MGGEPTVYVTHSIPDAGLSKLEPVCELEVWAEKLPPGRETILVRLEELEPDGQLYLLSDEIGGTVMEASPALDVISTYSVGYDHVDMDAARERSIAVGHTPGVLTETTANLAWSLLMATARCVIEGNQYVRDEEGRPGTRGCAQAGTSMNAPSGLWDSAKLERPSPDGQQGST